MSTFNTCRFCDNWRDQDMVRYSTRHLAHFKCYLDAGKDIYALPDWQIARFPYFLLKERMLLLGVSARLEGYLKKQREIRDHPANIETSMLYRKTQTMGIVSKSRDPMKVGKMSPSMAKALEIADRRKR